MKFRKHDVINFAQLVKAAAVAVPLLNVHFFIRNVRVLPQSYYSAVKEFCAVCYAA